MHLVYLCGLCGLARYYAWYFTLAKGNAKIPPETVFFKFLKLLKSLNFEE